MRLHPGREQALDIQIDGLIVKHVATSVSRRVTVVLLDVTLVNYRHGVVVKEQPLNPALDDGDVVAMMEALPDVDYNSPQPVQPVGIWRIVDRDEEKHL